MSILKPETMVFTFDLFIFSSIFLKENEVDIIKAVLIFLPIVFSQAGRSAAALELLVAGSFSFNPHLQRRFTQENWDQLFSASYKACKLAIAAEGDMPVQMISETGAQTIPEPSAKIGMSSRGSGLRTMTRGDMQTIPEPGAEIGRPSRGSGLRTMTGGDMQTIPEPGADSEIGRPSRGSGLRTLSRWLKGLFKSSKS